MKTWIYVALLGLASALPAVATPGVDDDTIALWLFDEAPYHNITLTDAGRHELDLRLATGRAQPLTAAIREGRAGILPGRFGSALHLPLGEGKGVTWAEGTWEEWGTAPMRDRGNEVPEILNLGYLDYTIEFWFKAAGPQEEKAVIWELRNQENSPERHQYLASGYNALGLDAGRAAFFLEGVAINRRGGRAVEWEQRTTLPTDPARLADGAWHHVAFTYTAREHQMRHYLDGRLQPLPEIGGWLPMQGGLVSLSLGRTADGAHELHGALDEFRVSHGVRYSADFTPPASFSRNFGADAPATAKADGPPLLFGPLAPARSGPVALGNRKHVFLDDALLARKDDTLRFTPNPPTRVDATDFRSTRPWEPSPRMGAAVPDICSFWEQDGEIRMLYGNNAMWGGKSPTIMLATSRDGLHWEKPELGLHSWDGSTRNNIVLRNALQGTAIHDPNPAEPADRRFKMKAWLMRRGFYLFTSPDGVHWKRNESVALPFDPDASCEIFWDDQAGVYRTYLRSTRHIESPQVTRRIVYGKTADVLKPWPFTPVAEPEWHLNNRNPFFVLPKPNHGQLPLIDTGGQVYRMKGVKYPWAPDTYLAFPWRYIAEGNIRPGSLTMVSRDGENWNRYEPPYYFASGWEFEGRKVVEALMEQGMVRRGDEIWQYGTIRFTEHGGALYGGVEHDGSGFDRLLRLTQRLDGFVSLDAGVTAGTATTQILIFAGSRLELNVAAKGAVRVALLDASGRAIPGFALADCDPIRADSVRHRVSWKGSTDVSRLAGQPVQVQLELHDAKLFALQFQ